MKWLASKWKNFVLYALCDFEPMKWFEMRGNVMEVLSFCDSTSSRVENELKTNDVEEKGVAVV